MLTHPARSCFAAAAALLAISAYGCTADTSPTAPTSDRPSLAIARHDVTFTVGPLVLTGIEQRFPDGRWQLRDVFLNGPVTGDVTGTADIMLEANLDTFIGSGPAHGTMAITTATGDVWDGNVTGSFLSGAPLGIQLFSSVVLHGPGQQTLRAECNETSAPSEVLACTGDIQSPHR